MANTLTHANGNVYDGKWRGGRESGTGRLIFEGGSKAYEGTWHNGAQHRQGKEISLSDGWVLR